MPRPTGTIGETKLKILAIICVNESRGTTTYGYDIWKVLKEGFHVYFDEGNLRNVYRHLKDLEKAGLISRGPQQTIKGVPRRQPYSLTQKGREMEQKFAKYVDLLSSKAKIVQG